MEYSNLLKECDRILKLMEGHSSTIRTDIFNIHTPRQHSPAWAQTVQAIDRLIFDKLITSESNGYHSLTGISQDFINNGGYDGLCKRETERENEGKYKESLRVRTDQNTIATGNSVQGLNRLMKPATITQIILGIVTLAISGYAAYLTYLNYDLSKANNVLESRLKSLESKVQNIEDNIKKLPRIEGKDTAYKIMIPASVVVSK